MMVEVQLKSPYRDVEGETEMDRAMRIRREGALRQRYRESLSESRGASRTRLAEAERELRKFAMSQSDKDWMEVNWMEYVQLARRVVYQANKWRAKRKVEEIKVNMRNAGMIE